MLADERVVATCLHQHEVEDDALPELVSPSSQGSQLPPTDQLQQTVPPPSGSGPRRPVAHQLLQRGPFSIGARSAATPLTVGAPGRRRDAAPQLLHVGGAQEVRLHQRGEIRLLRGGGELLVYGEEVGDGVGRSQIALAHVGAGMQVMEAGLEEGKQVEHPPRQPLQLVGDGVETAAAKTPTRPETGAGLAHADLQHRWAVRHPRRADDDDEVRGFGNLIDGEPAFLRGSVRQPIGGELHGAGESAGALQPKGSGLETEVVVLGQ